MKRRFSVLCIRDGDGFHLGSWTYTQRKSALRAAQLLDEGNRLSNVHVEAWDMRENVRLYKSGHGSL